MTSDELLKRLDVSHLETFDQDDVEYVSMDCILENYHWAAARIRELESELDGLKQSLVGLSIGDITKRTHVIVPVEPTMEMLVAGSNARFADNGSMYASYRAMISAAQPNPKPKQGE